LPIDAAAVDADVEKFFNNVQRTEGCWVWQGGFFYRNHVEKSYGVFFARWFNSRLAHRFSYLIHYGELSDSLKVLHHCDNPQCVRPDHLFLGTQQDNVADMHAKGRDKKAKGSQTGNAKLTEEDIKAIRSRYV
jgi:hypothetical protein